MLKHMKTYLIKNPKDKDIFDPPINSSEKWNEMDLRSQI